MACRVSVQWAAGARTPAGCRRATLHPLIRRAVRATVEDAGHAEAEISITLLDDEAIAAMNREHLDHDGITDVISFALWERGEVPVGDVYIGVAQAARQASALDVAVAEEIVRLAIHGALHVLGHDHADGEDRSTGEMWQVQERLVREVLG
jgi:probable rRNA maturation factor